MVAVIDGQGDRAGLLLIKEVDTLLGEVFSPGNGDPLSGWKIAVVRDDRLWRDGMEEGVMTRDVVGISPHDDDIGTKIHPRSKEPRFGDQSGISCEKKTPSVPMESDHQTRIVCEAIAIDLNRSVENF